MMLFRSHPGSHIPSPRGSPTAGPVSVATAPGSPSSSPGQSLPPARAKASDAGETRSGSAGQRRGFLSKCLWLGFLLTEGRLQLSADIPRGGSQALAAKHVQLAPGTGARLHSMQLSDDVHRDAGVRPREL